MVKWWLRFCRNVIVLLKQTAIVVQLSPALISPNLNKQSSYDLYCLHLFILSNHWRSQCPQLSTWPRRKPSQGQSASHGIVPASSSSVVFSGEMISSTGEHQWNFAKSDKTVANDKFSPGVQMKPFASDRFEAEKRSWLPKSSNWNYALRALPPLWRSRARNQHAVGTVARSIRGGWKSWE